MSLKIAAIITKRNLLITYREKLLFRMPPLKRNSIRIEYDRTDQNQEVSPYWPNLEDRPYFELERRYSEGEGPVDKFYFP